MKRTLLSMIVFCTFQCPAQDLAISADANNVFYAGLDNPVSIACAGIKQEKLIVEISGTNNEIRCVGGSRYIVRVTGDTNSCQISVYIKKRHRQIGKWHFTIRKLLPGNVLYGKLKSGNYTLDEILAQEKMVYYGDGIITGRVSKFNLIIVPKEGEVSEFKVLGNNINHEIREKILRLRTGDLIYIEGIVGGPTGFLNGGAICGVLMRFEPIALTVSNKDHKSNIIRVIGYYRVNDVLQAYIYPTNDFSPFNPEPHLKDSIWIYYTYDVKRQTYKIHQKDSFYKGMHICAYFYNDSNSKIAYRLQKISDSTWFYESYYSNGSLYQRGIVIKNNGINVYRKSLFYEEKLHLVKKDAWEKPLFDVHRELYPFSQWEVFDSSGHLLQKLNYGMKIDNSFRPGEEKRIHFIIVLVGKSYLYNTDGTIKKEVVFKDGEEVK